MEELKLANHNTTLVDSVEESLISYFKEQGLRPGCSIPNEMELAASLGVGRAVLREALSRFKMTGMIVSRTKKGMVLGEPSLLGGMKRCINPLLMNESTLCDILEFRVALEIGISDNIFRNLTDADVAELKEIVEMSQVIGNNKYAPVSEHRFTPNSMKSRETRSSPNFRTSSIPCWISSRRSTATFWNRSKRSWSGPVRW